MSLTTFSDMNDSDDLPETQPLRGFLEYTQEHVYPAFHDSDAAARQYQKRHQLLTRRVAWLGSAATILAVFQLFAGAVLNGEKPSLGSWPMWAARLWQFLTAHAEVIGKTLAWIEGPVVLVMFLLVIHGMTNASQQKQLLERFKAERLRLLKFGFLLDPDLWSGDEARIQRLKDELARKVDEIVSAMRPSLDRWISEGAVPRVWPGPERELSGPELISLQGYFRRKRLEYQKKYLSWATKRARERDDKTRVPVAVLFFGSVVFVLVHVCVEAVNGKVLGQFFVFLAAALPALVTPLRVVRAVYESSRNASRFEANYNTLEGLSERLSRAENSADVFRELGFCEQVLEADHREWMRLMAEAEWFG